MSVDLNKLEISTDCGTQKLIRVPVSDGEITVFFEHLEQRIIQQINRANFVVGCVAWLTSEQIIKHMACVKYGVSIVVQKEDFLRPDIDAHKAAWKSKLRDRYRELKNGFERHEIGGMVGSLSGCADPWLGAVRCVGNHNRAKSPAFPRMHHKFLVFCRVEEVCERDEDDYEHERSSIIPYAVWTGSFNLTANAAMSLENAVLITSQPIVDAYYREWHQITALSEPLDWESDWCEPEWRIGT